jgi:hypothetical protein
MHICIGMHVACASVLCMMQLVLLIFIYLPCTYLQVSFSFKLPVVVYCFIDFFLNGQCHDRSRISLRPLIKFWPNSFFNFNFIGVLVSLVVSGWFLDFPPRVLCTFCQTRVCFWGHNTVFDLVLGFRRVWFYTYRHFDCWFLFPCAW